MEPEKSLIRTLNRGFAGLLPGIDFANHADDVEYGVRELAFEVYFFFGPKQCCLSAVRVLY